MLDKTRLVNSSMWAMRALELCIPATFEFFMPPKRRRIKVTLRAILAFVDFLLRWEAEDCKEKSEISRIRISGEIVCEPCKAPLPAHINHTDLKCWDFNLLVSRLSIIWQTAL